MGIWYLETMTDTGGNIIAANYKNGEQSSLKANMTCRFNSDGTFEITKDNNKVWSGSYTKIDADNGIMLSLKTDDERIVQAGLCEKRYYNGES